jgi:acyl-CoA reductase-like NAD-dependent aldehyde dehydrogenase
MMSKLLIGGEWIGSELTTTIFNKYTGEPLGPVAVATPQQVDDAVAGVRRGFETQALSPHERFSILSAAADLVAQRADIFIPLITAEAGFTRADGDSEVRRCQQTLQLCAEEAKRLAGDMIPMDATPGLRDRIGFTIRVPRGVVCAITPYNSPLNTVAHKLGPALAGGNAVILKPSEHTPLTAALLCQALLDAGLPPALLALVHGTGDTVGRQLLADPRINFYTFTGSTRVGREIQQAAGLRGTQLELGSIASTIVFEDADVAAAIPKLINACFRKAGQVCTSVQRILVDRRILPDFTERFVAAAKSVKFGDPSEPGTVVGPMISEAQACRAESWIAHAYVQGARVLAGGRRHGSVLEPTVLTDVKPEMRVMRDEVFAPVVSIVGFDTAEEAYAIANNTPYGLAVGVFTKNLSIAFDAARQLHFGGIHINETSSSRVDVMPFGGVKDSGFGREGPHYAVREMTEERLVTIAY